MRWLAGEWKCALISPGTNRCRPPPSTIRAPGEARQVGADGADPVAVDQHVDGAGHRVGGRGVVDQHLTEQHGHGRSTVAAAGNGGKGVGARGVQPHRHQAGRDADGRGDAVDDGTPSAVGQRADEVGQAGAAEHDGLGLVGRDRGAGRVGERVEQVGRAVDQLRDRHVDRGHGAAVLEPERADNAVAVGDGAGGQRDHDEPVRHQAGGLQRGLGHPDDRTGGDLAGRGTPVSPKQAMTNASVSAWCSRTCSSTPTAAIASSAWLSTLGTPTAGLTPVTVTPAPATACAAAVMVAVSSAEVFGLITVIRVIAPPRV